MISFREYASLILVVGLAGCATLPSSGPTGKQIETSLKAPDGGQSIQLIEIRTIADVPQSETGVASVSPLPDQAPPPTDRIGPGDILDVNIYEAGVTLFSAGGSGVASQVGANPGVQVQKLPPTRVDDLGNIVIPYAGKLHVAGLTTDDVGDLIRNSLLGLSQSPQVVVTLSQAITNSIIIGGEVNRPGRLALQTNRETLSDVIALVGGYRGNAKDLSLRVMRGAQSVDVRINDLIDNPALDVRVLPGDRLMLISNPRSYSVLGASGRVEQLPFNRSSLSLAEAIAAAGGANPGSGDPAAIFLFRYVKDRNNNDVPVVYHLNMMKAGSFFLAQRFPMRNNDVLYFGNAAANQPSKLIQLISQLFSPILTVTSTVQVLQNSN
jgi:polysaccharide export outer membrane protein